MSKNLKIIQIKGDDPQLFTDVGPLVMDAKVIKANNNYAFKTSPLFVWHIAYDKLGAVIGFLPIERRKSYSLINNYYVAGNDAKVFRALLKSVSFKSDLEAVVQIQHQPLFEKALFTVKGTRSKYVKMIRPKKETESEQTEE